MSTAKQEKDSWDAHMAADAAESTLALNPVVGVNLEDLAAAARTTILQGTKQPLILVKHVAGFGRKLVDALAGEARYAANGKDRRFQHSAWEDNRFYHGLLQAYLALDETLEEWVDDVDFDDIDRLRARFIMRVLSESIAPTNTLLGNPAALRHVADTRGKSIVQGLGHLFDDIRNNGGMPAQVDKSQFKVGKNLALSPGAVVFKNDIMELIQYQSAATKVYKRPLLLVPPQINKFYGMDLAPEKSLVKYCTDNGIQLFAISWRNPRPEHSEWALDDYVDSIKEGIQAIKSITRSADLNLIGFCSGGVTASALAAHLDATGDRSIHAMTIGVCVLELQPDDSDISAFSSDAAVSAAKKRSRKAGVLRGRDLARTFNWMRSNDLIWNYVVNNYLMGNKPPAFDILYWNNDTTNLPAGLHADYVNIFSSGAMTSAGEISVCNTPVDLEQLECDKFFLAGVTDHITPWKACYRSAQAYGGNAKFVLSHSGHVQSLINPPGNPRASYLVNDDWADTPDEWLTGAERRQGSWWPVWMDWLQERSGELKRAPRRMGNTKYQAGDAAPGEYVHQQAE